MLKKIVKLFDSMLSRYFYYRTEFISHQAFPSYRINLDTNLTTYLPPCDGYIGFYKPAYNHGDGTNLGVDLFAHGADGNITARATLSSNISSFLYSATIPCQKGIPVSFYSNNLLSECWFSPSIGSRI